MRVKKRAALGSEAVEEAACTVEFGKEFLFDAKFL